MYLQLDINIDKCLQEIIDTIWIIQRKWREDHSEQRDVNDAMSHCMLQMMMTKLRSLQVLAKGLPVLPNKPSSTKIMDIPSLASIVRGIYEMAFIYHNIFINTENEQERDILLTLWKIRGFNNRQNLNPPEDIYIKKIDDEKTYIESLRHEIVLVLDKMNIIQSARKTIERAANKDNSNICGYKFEKNDSVIVSFKSVPFSDCEALFSHNYFNALYPYFSFHSHPSYLGVLQFGQMFNAEADKDMAKTIIISACICASKFTKDFCDVVADGEKYIKDYTKDFFSSIGLLSMI